MANRKDVLWGACKDFEQDLVIYYYKDCGDSEQARLQSHLEGCAHCRRFLEELGHLLPVTVKNDADELPAMFWQDYSREMRVKLAASETRAGWRWIVSWFHPWPVPAFATAMILALALTLTLTKTKWFQRDWNDPEVVEMAANADFFESLDFLESMDLLEAVEGQEAQKGETASQHL